MVSHTAKQRHALPPYTRGWFVVGWSDDLPRGALKQVRQFGHQFTLFRGADGLVGVVDDVCPHLGARFSEGGTVQGNCVRCPYHHWSFDRAGACTNIPYSQKIPVKARVRSHTVTERYGMIFMYRDQAGGSPDYPLPAMEDFVESEFERPAQYTFTIRIHPQDIMENSVDSAHFRAVHGHATAVNHFRAEGKQMRITQRLTVRRFFTEIKNDLEFHMIEPGFHYVHFPRIVGHLRAVVFSSIVPIDDQRTNHRLAIWVSKSPVPGVSRLLRRFIVADMMRTYHEDMQIWESKEYLPHPVLCDGDGAIIKLRRWYAQFFEAAAAATIPASPADADG